LGAVALLVLAAPAPRAQTPLGTAFTYQGRLTDGGAPLSGSYDLQFTLFDAASGGPAVGGPVTLGSVAVSSGNFTVSLDFGANAFTGSARWLAIGVRPGGSGGSFTVLSPRQELTASPNALYAASTATRESYQGRFVSPAAVTAFWHLVSGNTNATEASTDTLMPTSCTFDRLYVTARAHTTPGNPAGGHSYTFTLRKNGASTALTCSLTSVTAGVATCSDTDPAHAVNVAANDLVDGMVVDTQPGLVTTPVFQILFALNCR
jgi:hypothetical protein